MFFNTNFEYCASRFILVSMVNSQHRNIHVKNQLVDEVMKEYINKILILCYVYVCVCVCVYFLVLFNKVVVEAV